jgi:hypothetical protein
MEFTHHASIKWVGLFEPLWGVGGFRSPLQTITGGLQRQMVKVPLLYPNSSLAKQCIGTFDAVNCDKGPFFALAGEMYSARY